MRGSLSRRGVQGSLCPGGSLSRGSLFRGVSVKGGLCPGGSLSRGISVLGNLCPGGSLSGCLYLEGFLSSGGLCPEGSLSARPPRMVSCGHMHPTGMYSCYNRRLLRLNSHPDDHQSPMITITLKSQL